MTRSTQVLAAGVLWTAMAAAAWAQKAPPPRPADGVVDPARVDAAIDKGVRFLRGDPVEQNPQVKPTKGGAGTNELKLLTLLHGGVPETDAFVQELLKWCLQAELRKTYNVSLLAVALEELNRVTHQEKIWQCAQFLVDNMAPNGEWGYGEPTTYTQPVATAGSTKRVVASKPAAKPRTSAKGKEPVRKVKPPVTRFLPVKKQRDGTNPHDNSNSQYAALGLRASHDAGIVLPKDVIEKAMKWWVDTQLERSARKADPNAKGAPVATEGAVIPAGWSYQENGVTSGSMTVGGVGSMAIYHYILGQDWRKDPVVQKGVEWIARNFTVTENPGSPSYHLYYLYGLERAGVLYGTETFGTHVWYLEGARELLAAQKADGSWGDGVVDTCFAILFLRRATAPLVASVDPAKKR